MAQPLRCSAPRHVRTAAVVGRAGMVGGDCRGRAVCSSF